MAQTTAVSSIPAFPRAPATGTARAQHPRTPLGCAADRTGAAPAGRPCSRQTMPHFLSRHTRAVGGSPRTGSAGCGWQCQGAPDVDGIATGAPPARAGSVSRARRVSCLHRALDAERAHYLPTKRRARRTPRALAQRGCARGSRGAPRPVLRRRDGGRLCAADSAEIEPPRA